MWIGAEKYIYGENLAAPRAGACAGWAAALTGPDSGWREKILRNRRGGDDVKEAMHLKMSQAAQLRANDFVASGAVWREVDGDDHAGDSVLLEAQFADEEIVDHVLRAEQQLHAAIDGHGEHGDDNVASAAAGSFASRPSWLPVEASIIRGSRRPNFLVGTCVTERVGVN